MLKRAICCRRECRNVAHAEAAKDDESAKETENLGGAGGKRDKGGHRTQGQTAFNKEELIKYLKCL